MTQRLLSSLAALAMLSLAWSTGACAQTDETPPAPVPGDGIAGSEPSSVTPVVGSGVTSAKAEATPPADDNDEVTTPDDQDEAEKQDGVMATDADNTEQESDGSEAIPNAYGEDRYQASWDKNPFLLKTVDTVQTKENFGKDWALASLSAYKNVYTVRIFNKQTGKYERLKEGDTSGEFRLIGVTYNRDRNKTKVTVAQGNETAELTYDESTLSRPVTVQNTQTPPPAQPGQPQPGQQPQNPNPNAPANQRVPMPPGANPGAQQANARQAASWGRPNTPAPVPGAPPGVNPATGMPAVTPPQSRRRSLIPAPIMKQQEETPAVPAP